MNSLIVHPDSKALARELDQLREKLARLLDIRITILFEELPALRYRYSELFGELERTVEQRALELTERKRMVELFALKLDRGQKLDRKTITLTMKIVYKEFEQIRQRVTREASRNTGKGPGDGWRIHDQSIKTSTKVKRNERRELRALYLRLAKRLHPDGKGEHSNGDLYWELTQRSYQRGDIQALRTLLNVLGTTVDPSEKTSPEGLTKHVDNITQAIANEEKWIAELRSTEPYSLRENFDDEDWIAERKATLQKELANFEAELSKCNAFLAPILSGEDEHITPEAVNDTWQSFVEDVYLSGRF